jgi:hypothetical protein
MSATPEPPVYAESPQITRLTLSRAGKRIVILFIVLGVLGFGASTTVSAISTAKATRTAQKLDGYHADVGRAFTAFAAETQGCAGQLACLHEADAKMAAALQVFLGQLDHLEFPATAVDDAQKLRGDVTAMIDLLHVLEGAAPVEYNRALPQLQTLANRFDADYAVLVAGLPAT